MKHKIKFICRQIVAYVCVIALLVTQNTVLVLSADENGNESNLIIAKINNQFPEKAQPRMEYNGTNEGEVHFSDYRPDEIASHHDVTLYAKAKFKPGDINASDEDYYGVEVSDFRLEGRDADKYCLENTYSDGTTLTANIGKIYKKHIECIPNNNVHYKNELSTVDIQGCTFKGVVEGEEIKLAEGLQWSVGYSGGEYCYKVLYKESDGSNIDVTHNIPINSENYIVTAVAPVVKDKPVVSASVKLAAQGDNNIINYVQDKGIVANSSVIISVEAEADSDVNDPMTFTLYSGETMLAEPLTVGKNSDGQYVADFILELSDKEGCYSREIKDLKYTINGMQKPENLSVSLNGESSNTVILDKDAPVQASDNPVSLNYDNAQKTVTVKGGFEDNLSGVKKIEYKLEGKEKSVVVNNSSFEHTYKYSDLNDLDCNGQYGIELKVTDNAENTLSITDSDGDGGIDNLPPVIEGIKLSAIKGNTELELKEVLKNSDSGNYSKETLKLEITAVDDADFKQIAAISKVMLLDGEAIKYEQQGNIATYVFYLENDVISDLKVKLVDIYGNKSKLYSLKELLAEHEKESGINWNELKTNSWIIDKANPEISVEYGVAVQKNNEYYYNLNGGTFEIRVKEKNGLSEFTVKQEYNGASVDIYPSRTDEDDDGIFTCSVDVNSLSTGWYNYTVKAVDNAGRFDERYCTFYVDKETPSGEIQAFALEDNVRTDVSVIDNENWMTEKDQNGNNRFITFRTYIKADGSDVEAVNFVINGDTRHPVTATLDGSEINGYSDGLFTVLHNKLSVEDTTNRKYIDLVLDTSKWTSEQKAACGNTFNISANVKAISQNTSKEILYDLHIDTEKPEINQIVVSKKNTSLENIVNILSFGAFFNDTILISVKATDGDNDAGISKVTLKHDYLTEEAEMVFDEDSQMYTCDLEIPAGESIFKSNITVKVYDKMGNSTTDYPNDNNVQGSGNVPNNYFVMIEQNPPTATIELPTGDNRNVVYKSNGEVWLNATDQKICVSVNDQGEENSGIREVVVEVDVKDKDGHISSQKIEVDKNGNKLLTADATKDNNEKISEVSYEFSSNDIAAMCNKPDNESYTVKCKVVDNAGNVGCAVEKVFYRDITDPAITMFEFTPKSENGVESTTQLITEADSNQLEYGYFFKNPSENDEVKLTATLKDTADENGNSVLSSGFKKVIFRLVSAENGVGETKQTDYEIDNNKAECIIPANFKGKVYAKVFDIVDNKSEEKTSKAFVLDEDKPVIDIEPLPDNKAKLDDMGNKLYTRNIDTVGYVENVEFEVTISDSKSGLSEISYAKSSDLDSFDEAVTKDIDYKSENYKVGTELADGWKITEMDANLVTKISKTFTFDKDDKNIFMTFNAVDNALIKADTTTTEKFTIDSVSPTVDKFNFQPVTEDNISEAEEFIEELEYGFYFKKQFNAVVTVNDTIPSSGLDKVLFRLVSYDKGEVVAERVHEINVLNKNAVCTIPAGFKGQIYAQVSDRAENTSQEQTPQAFVVEEIPPVITIEPLPDNESKTDMAGNKLYTGPVKFKVTISDEKAGLRELVYSQTSENESFKDVVTTISNTSGYKENDIIDNGWQVTKTDRNLITEVSQVFTFTEDDNDIVMSFRATDRSKNTCETMQSEAFTIDTIAPKVTITNAVDPVNDMYYKDSTTFVVTVTERNFDPKLMRPTIKNTYTDAKVPYEFVTSASNSNEHIATFVFYEGDYSFAFTGTDRGGHKTDITTDKDKNVKNDFFAIFNVDATAPVITTNFKEFGNVDDKQIYFNTSKTATIEVVEHNFYESDMNIVVESKSSGTGHESEGEGWYNIGYVSDWVNNGDKHTLQIKFEDDGIYKISISPTDRAGNTSASVKSAVYEIDTKVPEIYSRNNKLAHEKDFVKSPYYMIYDEKEEKKKTPAPSIEFDDINFDRIEIEAVIYRPEYKNGKEFGKVTEDSLSKTLSVPVKKKQFTVPNFDKDGVYVITYTAVDKAGNRSEPINDTYFRMVETDVLAYINNSSLKDKTGYYSLMDENGKAVSKKASDFKDLSISVIKLKENEEAGVLKLREEDEEYLPGEKAEITTKEVSQTAVINDIKLPASYFSETFRDDGIDTRMSLSVSIKKDSYLDLASIHIDNEKPDAKKPDDFVNWHNYFFTKEVTISLTNITETLNADLCKVYECPRNDERTEIPFEYDKEKKLLTFVLKEGLHNIDITLVDEAGNEWNLDRVKNIRVGNFRLYTGAGVSVVAIGSTTGIVLWRRRKRLL